MKSDDINKALSIRLAVAFIIAIIIAIYYFSERRSFEYQGYDKNINLLQRYNAELNEAVVKTRFGMLENYDDINTSLNSLVGVVKEFQSWLEKSPNDKIKNKVHALEKSIDLKKRMIYLFERINPVLINATSQFSKISTNLIGDKKLSDVKNESLDNLQNQIADKVNILFRKMLIYINLPNKADHDYLVALVSEIETLSVQAKQLFQKNANTQSMIDFNNLDLTLIYAKKMLSLQPQASMIDQQLFEIPVIANLNDLNNAFSSLAENHLKKSSTYRIILYVFVFFLLIVLKWSFSRLQNMLVALNKEVDQKNVAEKKLEETNRKLEERVTERTKELSIKNNDLNKALANLKETQEQLIIQEKMASVGILTTGIAHEIKNPLNFVNNFSEISIELLSELRKEIAIHYDSFNEASKNEITEILNTLNTNIEKIKTHGEKADNIVKTMMLHSSETAVQKEIVDLQPFIDNNLRITLEAFQAAHENFLVSVKAHYDESLRHLFVSPQAMGRVFIYIIDNALYAMFEKQSKNIADYHPILTISGTQKQDKAIITIHDNGTGISKKFIDKIFQPFYTTKPTGKGNTGLGLSICYDIVVKQHKGELQARSEEGVFTEVTIILPLAKKIDT